MRKGSANKIQRTTLNLETNSFTLSERKNFLLEMKSNVYPANNKDKTKTNAKANLLNEGKTFPKISKAECPSKNKENKREPKENNLKNKVPLTLLTLCRRFMKLTKRERK
jgi:hypothetical protein